MKTPMMVTVDGKTEQVIVPRTLLNSLVQAAAGAGVFREAMDDGFTPETHPAWSDLVGIQEDANLAILDATALLLAHDMSRDVITFEDLLTVHVVPLTLGKWTEE